MTKPITEMSAANIKEKFISLIQGNLDNESLSKKVAAIGVGLKSTPTILAKDIEIDGQISSSGVIEIEGHVKGIIKGNVVALRENGFVEGDIFAESINIRGRFEGNIRSKSITISSKARVSGKVEYETLFVEDGAFIDGQFKCLESSRK